MFLLPAYANHFASAVGAGTCQTPGSKYTLRICIIGVRGHYGLALEATGPESGHQIVGISAGAPGDSVAPLSDACRAAGHAPRPYEDERRMLDDLRPDVAVVCGPFERNAQISIDAFGRGVHVFCEKPVATTLADLARLRDAHAASGVRFAAMMAIRCAPPFHAAWRAVREGRIGAVRLINARKSYKLGERPAHFRSRATSSGIIPWVGSHAIDWIHWFSAAAFRTVYAAHSAAANRGHGDLEMTALCLFTLADDILASASLDYLRPAEAPTHGDDRIRVAGTGGVVEVRQGAAYLIGAAASGEECLAAPAPAPLFAGYLDEIAGRGHCIVSAAEVFAVTEACLLARQSADEKRVIQFP